jgi:hypothetical protein
MSVTILNTEERHKWKCSLMVWSMYLALKVLVRTHASPLFSDQLSAPKWKCSLMVWSMYLALKVLVRTHASPLFSDQLSVPNGVVGPHGGRWGWSGP